MNDAIRLTAASFKALRRDIHAHPELGFQETRTGELIAQLLMGWNIPVHRGLGKTGVVGVIRGRPGHRAIGIRADMDALPILEANRFSHASTRPGTMHACGHDGHIAMLLAAGQDLSQHRDFDGTVYLIFQPAEEGGGGGAREMMKDGLFKRFPMEAIFGVHNWPGLAAGEFAVSAGPVFASGNRFKMSIRGRGTHAAMPHHGIDPIPIACQVIQALQTIVTRNKAPLDAAVISTTVIHAGDAVNIVPESCEIAGTVRTFSSSVLDMIENKMQALARGICEAFGAHCDFEFVRYYPATVNHARESEFVRRFLGGLVGNSRVRDFEPTMSSEDFSFYLEQVPGCYFVIGNGTGERRSVEHGDGPCILHNGSYDFNDELLPLGAEMWVKLVEHWFKTNPA